MNTDIKQKIEPHGINTTAIQIVMEMEVTLQVIIPFHTKEIKVKQNVPIATRIVQGKCLRIMEAEVLLYLIKENR